MEKIATVSGIDSGGSYSARLCGQSPARTTTTARPDTIVSIEKIPTNILRKLDIDADRYVVAAQISATAPSSAAPGFNWIAGCTRATTANSATQTLNGFMGLSRF